MNNLKYKGILYFIAAVILTTLCIQVYWNYKNYQIGKQQLINDVQTSLDNAVDNYYTSLAKSRSFNILADSAHFSRKHWLDTEFHISDSIVDKGRFELNVSKVPERISVLKTSRDLDSGKVNITIIDTLGPQLNRIAFMDSLSNPVEMLSSKIMLSFQEDTLSLKKMDSLLLDELERKNINIDYGLTHQGTFNKKQTLRPEIIEQSRLSTASTSQFSFYDNKLTIHFSNITLSILKKNLVGIILSFILVAGVILCLLYLLKVIRHQKQLSELKNDLISNITHEFKTPIATIGVAMEAIRDFNTEQDPDKNLRYARISQEQVDKLNGMVEKLLETATLDSENLELNYETIDLVSLLENTTLKEIFISSGKNITFHTSEDSILHPIDVFHFENALNNIIDNAVKYGGEEISVTIKKINGGTEIKISDSGNELTDQHKKHLFEKFYRVPKGNTHDVKGFGIGLYYTKKIVEKHGGTIDLHLNKLTTFKIVLPDDPKN
ncbi:MAG: HAMP domain-containing histidine kinase [Bacteroidia bacterium]|nr:HAMP domain-containing histidine kinase [Bacteroidia bacterium]NNF29814.1 HAMP domain-containing histidine kinase [Flavobacteriaceae bacterium]MBT8275986.1 HAMP domain-containing histidine kinase [Bacteroidia bacterium]NNJ80816.1 HAMP domain-containing histidine kinase [Flavobacteriaceae bacterium]NNK55356.1 HAMP domain-containing histidine kinase [Flavobacteriaceae bacterium]